MPRLRLLRLLAIVASGLFVLAACSGDDTTLSSEGDSSSQSDSDSDGFGGGGFGDDDDDSDDDSTGGGAGAGGEFGSSGGPGVNPFGTGECADALSSFFSVMTAYGQAFTGAGTSEDYTAFSQLLDDYAGAAPSEIADSFEVMAEELGKFFDALAELDIQPGEQPDENLFALLGELSEEIDQDRLEQASDEISDWFDTNCEDV